MSSESKLIMASGRVEEAGCRSGEMHLVFTSEHDIVTFSYIISSDLLGSLTPVRLFSPPQCRNTAEERAGPFQQVWPPVNFMLACLKLL